MAQTEYREVLGVDLDKLYSVIIKYEDYPQFVEGCQNAEVNRGVTPIRVQYHVNVMSQDVKYTLDHFEDPKTGKVEWKLVDSNFFKKNNGKWELRSVGPGKTDVLYQLEVEFKVPVPGFILNRLVKAGLPGMVKSFEKRAKR